MTKRFNDEDLNKWQADWERDMNDPNAGYTPGRERPEVVKVKKVVKKCSHCYETNQISKARERRGEIAFAIAFGLFLGTVAAFWWAHGISF